MVNVIVCVGIWMVLVAFVLRWNAVVSMRNERYDKGGMMMKEGERVRKPENGQVFEIKKVVEETRVMLLESENGKTQVMTDREVR